MRPEDCLALSKRLGQNAQRTLLFVINPEGTIVFAQPGDDAVHLPLNCGKTATPLPMAMAMPWCPMTRYFDVPCANQSPQLHAAEPATARPLTRGNRVDFHL
jgi:hypothetical protein